MSCSDYISPSKSPFDKMRDIKTPVPELTRPPTTANVAMTTSSCDEQLRHDPPCTMENSLLISSVKYDYDPASLLAASDSVIGPDYDPSLYDTVEVAKKHIVKDER
jgi:hypothetical protein